MQQNKSLFKRGQENVLQIGFAFLFVACSLAIALQAQQITLSLAKMQKTPRAFFSLTLHGSIIGYRHCYRILVKVPSSYFKKVEFSISLCELLKSIYLLISIHLFNHSSQLRPNCLRLVTKPGGRKKVAVANATLRAF